MMRSMYSAVTGLRTHQGKLDTIGNNIANVNTVGFKKGQVTFKEVFNQMLRGASSATTSGIGGLNPQQVGMGVGTGSITTIHTRGAGQRTDNPTDLAIEGDGFFTVSDDINGINRYYTRAGNFNLDNEGNLVTSEGFRVLGYQARYDGSLSEEIKGIRIDASETVAPIRTLKMQLKGNLNSNQKMIVPKAGGGGEWDGTAEVAEWDPPTTDTVIRDSLGNAYIVSFYNVRVADNKWIMKVNRFTEVATGNYVEADKPINGGQYKDIDGLTLDGDTTLQFDSSGKLLNKPNLSLKIGIANLKFKKNKEGQPLGADLPINQQVLFGDKDSKISIFSAENPEAYNEIHQYANETTAKMYAQNGSTSGTLRGFSIGADGVILGVFDNGDSKVLGQIMLAKFANSTGLEKIASNLYKDSRNSGEPQLGKAGNAGYGKIASGTLEMSNVDLALEFTEMITTQRGFQANSRVITTSDEMLQELVNIKR